MPSHQPQESEVAVLAAKQEDTARQVTSLERQVGAARGERDAAAARATEAEKSVAALKNEVRTRSFALSLH
jgi:peptidoglycan hydrolase CwlO-like protein